MPVTAPRRAAPVRTGIDVLLDTGLGDLRAAALGLLTGPSGVTADLIPTAVALQRLEGAKLMALFGAEHGLRGVAAAGESVASSQDPATGLPVHSLYGAERAPSGAMLAGLDALIVDLQDVGLRYYTYPATVRAVLQAAARHGLPVLVLDRPNPLGGVRIEGPLLRPAFRSFVGATDVPIRHGLTIGELARWMNTHEGLGADLRVVPMEGWRRAPWHDETGLSWVPPSPNIPTAATGMLYGATCLLEGTTVSEGRGTAQPFALIGAPWIDADPLADRLNALGLPGVRFRPAGFRPSASKHAGAVCGGVQLHVTDPGAVAPIRTGLHLLATLRALYPEQTTWTGAPDRPFLDLLLGDDAPRLAIERGTPVEEIAAAWDAECAAFAHARRAILLYADEGYAHHRGTETQRLH